MVSTTYAFNSMHCACFMPLVTPLPTPGAENKTPAVLGPHGQWPEDQKGR